MRKNYLDNKMSHHALLLLLLLFSFKKNKRKKNMHETSPPTKGVTNITSSIFFRENQLCSRQVCNNGTYDMCMCLHLSVCVTACNRKDMP